MKSFFNTNKNITKYLYITLGAVLMAIAPLWYFERMGIVTGGVTGLAIIAKKTLGVPMWITNCVANLPLFVIGYNMLDKASFIRTLYATIVLTVLLGILPEYCLITGDYIVDVAFGSVIMGIGLGLILMTYTSSGGSDLLAVLLNMKLKHIEIPQIMAIIDTIIVVIGAGIFGLKKGVYAVIAIYIIERVSSRILEGTKKATQMCIILDDEIAISEYIINEISRGVTVIQVKGGYSGQTKKMIICVVSSREMIKIRQKLAQIDKNAICFIGDIREAFGEGFTNIG